MENILNNAESPTAKTNESPITENTGMSLDEIYHYESEQAYLEKFQAGVDFLMIQKMEGLI